jgi:hypothetical protein
MLTDDLLSLDQAARYIRRPKRELRELIRRGSIPAVRRDAKWMVQRRDLSAYAPAMAITTRIEPSIVAPKAAANSTDPGTPREEILAFISLLRDRDEQLALLQDERARLAGQVGYLQAQLADREARLSAGETTRLEPMRSLPARAGSGDDASIGLATNGSTLNAFVESTESESGREPDAANTSMAEINLPELPSLAPLAAPPYSASIAAPLLHVVALEAQPDSIDGGDRQIGDNKVDDKEWEMVPPPSIADRQVVAGRSRSIVRSLGNVLRRLQR